MPHSFGYRAGTRDLFTRGVRKHGAAALSTYMTPYKKGDFVDVVGNGAYHKGMPHKFYPGKTGRVFNVNPVSIGVIMNKQVRTRIIEKRIHFKVEHIKRSSCQKKFKDHVKALEAQKRIKNDASKKTKRMPAQPKPQMLIVTSKTTVAFQNPEFHKEIF